MSLVIAVSRTADSEPLTIPTRVESICSSVVETDDQILYTPHPGKLVELLHYLNTVGLTYQLKDE
ncbi:MAG TPA: hypothetical protein VFT90_11635 [Chryseosolibacter sp.]|nr:hypothetical protein [Chryseosolibacter sp.]